MAPIGTSVFVRLAAALLAMGIVFNILVATSIFAPAGVERARLAALPEARQAAAIVGLIEDAPLGARASVLEALNSSALRVELVAGPPAQDEHPGLARRTFTTLLSDYDGAFGDRALHVDLRPRGPVERVIGDHRGERWAPVRLYVRLHDGAWVLLEPTRAAILDTFLLRGLAFAAVGGIIVLLGLWLAVRQTTKPIAELSDNVEAFADHLNAPPLREAGPREVRALAVSFNKMKGRIRDLVAERTRMLAAIAHDMRTYLTRLQLRAEFINDPEQRRRAERDLSEMTTLLNDTLLLAHATEDAGSGARSNPAQEVHDYVYAALELGRPVSMDIDLAEDDCSIEPLAFRRIIANLVDNAVRYGGGAHVSLDRAHDHLLLIVDDDGPGIPEADLARVVAPFERLENSRGRDGGGAGLGLSIVTALLEANSGSLTLSNRRPCGLRATARLPIASPAETQCLSAEVNASITSGED